MKARTAPVVCLNSEGTLLEPYTSRMDMTRPIYGCRRHLLTAELISLGKIVNSTLLFTVSSINILLLKSIKVFFDLLDEITRARVVNKSVNN